MSRRCREGGTHAITPKNIATHRCDRLHDRPCPSRTTTGKAGEMTTENRILARILVIVDDAVTRARTAEALGQEGSRSKRRPTAREALRPSGAAGPTWSCWT